MDVTSVSKTEVKEFGHQLLYNYRNQYNSFEAVSQQCVKNIYREFCLPDGDSIFALLRIFRSIRYSQLTPELQTLVSSRYPGQTHFLILIASTGIEADWCGRKTSKTRQAIPIGKNMSPMFKGILTDAGIRREDLIGDDVPEGKDADMAIVRLFHVQDVASSTYITDQENFVKPYGIKSAVVLSCQFLSGAVCILIGFSTVEIDERSAENFGSLGPYISTLLAGYARPHPIWESR